VVRERYWITLQPGEIRTCTSCHGVNSHDQQGRAEPTNPPEALRTLLRYWKTDLGGGAFVVRAFGERLGFTPSESEVRSLPDSLPNWLPFPDTIAALGRLKVCYQLAIISNVDDNFFAHTARRLEVPFDYVITAQQARAYKPSLQIFKLAQQRTGVVPSQWLHVGQSIYHDVVPAQSLGIKTVWVNRASPRPGAGAAKTASARPDLEVPDLKSLVQLTSENRELQTGS
jgi:2-haloacid dehalogenase